jgi:hypothetical protein
VESSGGKIGYGKIAVNGSRVHFLSRLKPGLIATATWQDRRR